MYRTALNELFFFYRLIVWRTIAEDFIVSYGVAVLSAGVARVTLHGINNTILTFLHDTHMVGCSVPIPIKKDNIACRWLIASVLPLPIAAKPVHTVRTEGKFRYDATVQIAALDGAP